MDLNSHLDRFFTTLAARGRGLLLLDYDGTVAPFVTDRFLAKPTLALREIILSILHQGRTHVVFVTGRPCLELLEVSAFGAPIEVWGCHGREHLDVEGNITLVGLSPGDLARLEQAAGSASFLTAVEEYRGVTVEQKSGCVAVHWRAAAPGVPDQLEVRLRAVWAPFVVPDGELVLRQFDGGLELCTTGRSKGDAILESWARYGRLASAAFLGDDLTDEDGFEALKGRGLCVLVRNEPRETKADVRITTPQGVHDFLRRWHHSLERAPS